MNEQIVSLSEDKLSALIEQSHEFHKVYELAMSEYGKAEIKLIDDILNFGYKIIQVIGIFAGFGFTGLHKVENIYLFFFGEIILFSAISYGIYQIKKIYTSNLESIQQSSSKKYKVFKDKSDFFQTYIKKFVEEKQLDFGEFKNELTNLDKQLLDEFKREEKRKSKNEGAFLNYIIILSLIGSSILLLSFINLRLNFFIFNKNVSSTIIYLPKNMDFWSSVSGFIGTLMLFFFGLPPRLSPDGHINLILEQTDNKEAKKYKIFQFLSYIALALIALSFLIQMVKIIRNI